MRPVVKLRNASMFGPPGHLYVYAIHARHCLNAVTEKPGRASAVLIRALEPLWGLDTMVLRRGTHVVRNLTRGPARLCEALNVARAQDGIDLTRNGLVSIHPWADHEVTVQTSGRIGISQASELPLRFFLDRNPFVSGRAADHSSRPQMSSSLAVSHRSASVSPVHCTARESAPGRCILTGLAVWPLGFAQLVEAFSLPFRSTRARGAERGIRDRDETLPTVPVRGLPEAANIAGLFRQRLDSA